MTPERSDASPPRPSPERAAALEALTDTVLALELRLGEPRLVAALFDGRDALAHAGERLEPAEVTRAGDALDTLLTELRSGARRAEWELARLVLDLVEALRTLAAARRERAERRQGNARAAATDPAVIAPAIVRPPPLAPRDRAGVPPSLAPAIVRPPAIAPRRP
jgi:chemotaxis protein histidine kinase CheA